MLLGLPLTATVANARNSTGWIFGGARSNNIECLFTYLIAVEVNETMKDKYIWARNRDKPMTDLSSQKYGSKFAQGEKLCHGMNKFGFLDPY